MLLSLSVRAQSVLTENAKNSHSNIGLKVIEVAVLRDVNPKLNLADIISGRGGVFVPQTGFDVTDDSWADANLWLRLTLQGVPLGAGQTAPALHLLEFQKSYLDEIRLYSPPLPGMQAWQMQASGDLLAQKDWVLRGLFPRFFLPSTHDLLASPEGKQVLYVRIDHLMPMAVSLKINPAFQSFEQTQKIYLALGLALGAMLFTGVISLALAILSKDTIFAWYFAYAVSAAMANASHSGIAHHLIWPVAGFWPGTATLTWLLAATCFQLQFCRVLFQSQQSKSWPSKAALVLGFTCLTFALTYPMLPTRVWIEMYFMSMSLILLAMVMSTLLVLLAWRQKNKLALAWLIAFVPLFATVVLGLLDAIGIVDDDWGYNLPIYAAALEVIVLGLALQWFARERHGQIEREKAIASTDPLTGFITSDVFHQLLRSDWQNKKMLHHDLAVAYVELITKASNAQHKEQLLLRSVRVLRSATRSQDTVAWLGDQLMAILMPNVTIGEDLTQRLSRIVALGLMPDGSDGQANVLRFRIVATTRQHFQGTLEQLDTQLRAQLAENNGWVNRPIRVIDHLSERSASVSAVIDSVGFDDIWTRASDSDHTQNPTIAPSPR